jgi:hypothetical protein
LKISEFQFRSKVDLGECFEIERNWNWNGRIWSRGKVLGFEEIEAVAIYESGSENRISSQNMLTE